MRCADWAQAAGCAFVIDARPALSQNCPVPLNLVAPGGPMTALRRRLVVCAVLVCAVAGGLFAQGEKVYVTKTGAIRPV